MYNEQSIQSLTIIFYVYIFTTNIKRRRDVNGVVCKFLYIFCSDLKNSEVNINILFISTPIMFLKSVHACICTYVGVCIYYY